MYEWVAIAAGNQALMDQLSRKLLSTLHAPLWNAIGRLSRIERQPVPYRSITRPDYERFVAIFGKPQVQRDIRVVDLLPASRDDPGLDVS